MRRNVYVVVSPHGYDFTLFCGGSIAQYTDEGNEVHILRVLNDARRSVSCTAEETVSRNAEETREAAAVLGATSFRDLGYAEDELTVAHWPDLRAQLVKVMRELKPFAVLSFDPWALYEEEFEHLLIARIVEDACRCSGLPLFHPDQLEGGLSTHYVAQRVYFGRGLSKVNHVVDISQVIERKVQAMRGQRTASEFLVRTFLQRLEVNR